MSTDKTNSPTTELDTVMDELTAGPSPASDPVFVEITASTAPEGREPSASLTEGPRVRWAAIVWGLLFAATAAGTLAVLVDRERRDAFAEWMFALSPTTAALYALLGLGALVLVAGLAGLLRRAQRRMQGRAARALRENPMVE